jgi:HD-like signal output (HDOD) protein
MTEHQKPLRAIIVEQDPAYQAAIRRLLQRVVPQWQCSYLSDAAAARAVLCSEPIDLLLTERLGPSDSGETLLEFSCQQSPVTIRVLMSADNSDAMLLATTHCAHLVLGKPFTEQQVTEVFKRVELLCHGPFTEHSRYQLGQINTLPIQRSNYQTLMKLLSDEESSTAALASSLAREAPLAAKLLQIANSAYLGFSRQTLDLAEVVTRLGRSMVKAVAFAVQLHSQYDGKIRADLHQRLLDDSFELATMASQLAKTQQSGARLAEQAFMAGLMQVLGPLVLLSAQPQHQQQLTEEDMFQEGIPDHCLISAYLMLLWGFDTEVCDAAMYRLSLNEVAQPTLLQTIMHLSSYVIVFRRRRQDEGLPVPCWTALQQFQLTETFSHLQQSASGVLNE